MSPASRTFSCSEVYCKTLCHCQPDGTPLLGISLALKIQKPTERGVKGRRKKKGRRNKKTEEEKGGGEGRRRKEKEKIFYIQS